MNPQDLIQFLWRHGYFWGTPSGAGVKQSDLSTLALTDRVVLDATALWQGTDANFEVLARVVHNRGVQADGGVGPVTRVMLDVPCCGMPHTAPPPGATFDFGDPGLNRAVATMQANATGSGSWPVPGCDPTRPGPHSIRVGLDVAKVPSTIKSYLDRALAEVVKAYAEIGLAVRYLQHTGTIPDCEISKRFESLSGSVIGWNEFPDPGTCNQTIQGRLDTGYAPGNWLMWANLECHETGHGVGLQHGNGSIMNPSILLVDPMTWRGTYSYPNLKRWFGGDPIPGGPDDPPPPTTDHNGIVLVGGKLYKTKFWEA